MILGALGFAYLLATFVLSAAFVRLFPHSRLARRLRLDLGYFPLLPALLVLTFARAAGAGIGHVAAGAEGLFTRLSGRRQYRRQNNIYNYPLHKNDERPADRR